MWGLRGNIPGLLWNFVAGVLLSWLFFILIPRLVPPAYMNWYDQFGGQISLNMVLQAIVAGLVEVLAFTRLIPGYEVAFPLLAGIILGFVGFWVGIGKGHTDYADRRNAAVFRKAAFWLSIIFAGVLFYRVGGYDAIMAAVKSNGSYYTNYQIVTVIQYASGALITGLLIFFIACVLASIHYRLEKYLGTYYQALLNPTGRQ
jgi:hypothetical protein